MLLLLLITTATAEFLRGATHIQLAGCNADCGRLEVKLSDDDAWRAVTSSNWTRADAIKTCARLGFEDVASISSPFAAAAARGDRAVLGFDGSVRTCVGGECSMPAVGVACRARGPVRDTAAAMARIDAWAPLRSARLRAALSVSGEGNATLSELTVSIDDIEAARALPFDGADRRDALRAQRRTIEFLERHPRAAAALQRLQARGLLEVTPIGIVLREGTSSDDAELAYEAYLASDPNGDVHFEIDGKRRLVPSPSTNDAVLALRRDGVARIRDWGVLTDGIAKKATRSLQGSRETLSSTSNGRVATARYADKRLERFFRSINEIASGYLGDAQLSGYKVVHIDTTSSNDTESYVAGLWHHDRVGNRLKAFVFLHDVDCDEGHPTEVAVGSHLLNYYRTDAMGASRFSNDYVRDHYEVAKLCGSKGGGFVVDTHTLHRGAVEGSLPRTVVVGEYHSIGKCAAMDALGLGLPCPSGDQFLVS
ncbi:unnamed protein product [Pelagomonas calceolata]|uniref:SRCR domain-containing protein n=1 Tax=Pelagomonas calceolata TaxID=35677 RepID=A0A7S3ZPC7_9STRA|nr:unnamed protein product [Pelagomonas calceolata]|mmetsp:Transcript_22182/g.62406  ORF Transcript_22182/g.62406 Transcript_22182/m.62406 type:complete len:482 (+) Transcript_22182:708-2153(+)